MFLSHDLGKNKYTMCVECTPREARRLNLLGLIQQQQAEPVPLT